jgi:putative aldouronate transport system substrate-binding protein
MTGDVSAGGIETSFTEIFGAFGVQPFDWMLAEGEIVYGGIQPGSREALALLQEWYAAGYIHPDFVTDRWWSEARAKFADGRVAYHNHLGSLAGIEALAVPAVPPIGPRGERGIRVHGMAGGQSLCFGAQLAREPRKVLRVLRLLETLMTDEQFYVETHIGREGEHWRWHHGEVEQLPPFDRSGERYRHCITGASQMAGATVLTFTGTGPEVYEKYAPLEPHRRAAWGRASVVGRYDVLPDQQALAQRLRRQQQVLFVDIIKGDAELADFARFASEWRQAGGEELRQGVRRFYARQLEITQP